MQAKRTVPAGFRQQSRGMTNPYRVEGKTTRILLYQKAVETPHELLIDTDDLPRVLNECGRIGLKIERHKSGQCVYAQFTRNGKTTNFHRWLVDAPDGMDVDHDNGNGLDDRRRNLRVVTHAENLRNRRMGSYNAFKMVMEHKSGSHWGAWVFLGEYRTEAEANRVYDDAFAALRASEVL